MKKAVGIFSGGLDSWLSALLIKNQGFDVYLLHFSSLYFGYRSEKLLKLKEQVESLNMKLLVYEPLQEYLDTVFIKPKYGYGSAKNPCVDCHAYMLAVAKKKMEELGAEFVFSGEVLDQRPMSQRKYSLQAVERESGLKGYLVRPLSAKLLAPTIAEQKGLLNRAELLDISGRGRRRQIELAKKLGLGSYPQPSGGCKFTDPHISERLGRMLETNKNIKWSDLELLKDFRSFHIKEGVWLFINRSLKDLKDLLKHSKKGFILKAKEHIPGASALLIQYGEVLKVAEEELVICAKIVARYTKMYKKSLEDVPICFYNDNILIKEFMVKPFNDSELERFRL